eukprot:TRINITY_DN5918_c0_g1_i3.p1 TRINITY_DN5918_c0_g1~~TRINITY_DN5918_c0_g1_i3.p1  ORF type:complete len:487 (+),score=133.97 TRINITY_DN5918_c0_g1_i3:57-1463(+)
MATVMRSVFIILYSVLNFMWWGCFITVMLHSFAAVRAYGFGGGGGGATRTKIVWDAQPAEESALARGLVSESISYRSFLLEHSRYYANTSHRNFHGTVLGYVTPWNPSGYDAARKFRAKLTHVSPVWYQLIRTAGGIELTGGHDVDRSWMASVRVNGHPRIVPRVVLEGWPLDQMLMDEQEQKKAIDLILNECLAQEYDGVVLEAWSAWTSSQLLQNPSLRGKALSFISLLGEHMHSTEVMRDGSSSIGRGGSGSRSLQLFFVIPPPSTYDHPSVFTATDVAIVEADVDGFSVMTYDFSNPAHPGPNSPLPWIHSCLSLLLPAVDPVYRAPDFGGGYDDAGERKHPSSHGRELKSFGGMVEGGGGGLAAKVLLGLNFYGNDFMLPSGGGPIVGKQFLQLVEKYRPKFVWNQKFLEHLFKYTDEHQQAHQVFYPSLLSLALRLGEAEAWGTGVAVWELGQGLDFFFDLF